MPNIPWLVFSALCTPENTWVHLALFVPSLVHTVAQVKPSRSESLNSWWCWHRPIGCCRATRCQQQKLMTWSFTCVGLADLQYKPARWESRQCTGRRVTASGMDGCMGCRWQFAVAGGAFDGPPCWPGFRVVSPCVVWLQLNLVNSKVRLHLMVDLCVVGVCMYFWCYIALLKNKNHSSVMCIRVREVEDFRLSVLRPN